MKGLVTVSMKYWLLVLVILFAPVMKADDIRFIDEHFVQDSALVLLRGATFSAVLEAFCHVAMPWPEDHHRAFCQHFAPEVATFFYLVKFQEPENTIEVWSFLNKALFAAVMVNILHAPGLQINYARWGVVYMVYLQVMQTMSDTTVRHLTGLNQTFLPTYALLTGVSTGLISGGFFLWLAYKRTLQYRPFVLLIAAPGVALISTFFYFLIEGSGELSFSEKAGAVAEAGAGALALAGAGAGALALAGAVAGTLAIARAGAVVGTVAEVGAVVGAGAGAVAGAVAEAVAVAVAEARAEARAGAGAVAGAVVEAGAVAVAVAGAGAGVIITVITGSITASLSQCSATSPILKGLTMTAVAGFPLMVSSWLVSWNRFVETNATAHETMQNSLIFSLEKFKAFDLESRVDLPLVWKWFTDWQSGSNPGIATPDT